MISLEEQVKENPTITWQFSYPKNPDAVSAIIKEKMGSEISHVDVEVPASFSNDNKVCLLGAHAQDGVQIREIDYMEFAVRLRYTLPVTTQQFVDFWNFILGRVGDQYDKAGIVGIVLNRAIKEKGHEFCSEVQADAISNANILNIRKNSCMVDPEQLRLIVASPIDCIEVKIYS